MCYAEMKKGGYSCSMKGCSNISGRESSPSFFRFPKDPVRAKLWLEKCDRTIHTPLEKLYTNYKVCGNHFTPSMFLNNLKNRLQPHAIPVRVKNDNESLESNRNNTTCIMSNEKHVNLNEIENISISGECDIKSNRDKQQCETEFSDKEQLVSVKNELIINEQCEYEQVDSVVHQQHQYTQTKQKLSNHSPRKTMLRGRISALHREVRKLKQQLERQKNNIQTFAKTISLKDYCEATDQFLPPEIADVVKSQVRLNNFNSDVDVSRVHYSFY